MATKTYTASLTRLRRHKPRGHDQTTLVSHSSLEVPSLPPRNLAAYKPDIAAPFAKNYVNDRNTTRAPIFCFPGTSGRHMFCRGARLNAGSAPPNCAKRPKTLPTGLAMGLAGALLSRRRPEMP